MNIHQTSHKAHGIGQVLATVDEQGNADGRIAPVAGMIWVSMLAYQIFAAHQLLHHPIYQILCIAGICIAGIVSALLWVSIHMRAGVKHVYENHKSSALRISPEVHRGVARYIHRTLLWYMVILIVACGCALLRAHVVHSESSHDPVTHSMTQGVSTAQIVFQTQTVTSSFRHGFDCMMRVSTQYAAIGGVHEPSHATIQVFAQGSLCSTTLGQQVLAQGRLHVSSFPAGFGSQEIPWFDVRQPITVLADSSRLNQARHRIYEAFIQQTRLLDAQSAVLIPGITMGLLGNNAILAQAPTSPEIDRSYAKSLQRIFTDAGIVHLMAVSGGHVVILLALWLQLCRAAQLPAWITWIIIGHALVGLRLIMMPAASLDRALMMAALAQTARCIGRPSSSISSFSWSIVLLLFAQPQLCVDLGFALSCTSVGAILAWSNRLTHALHRVMPRTIAATLAVTISAQFATTPITALINPQYALWAPLANILITPVIAIVTICGILGLCTAWCMPVFAHCILVVCSWCCSWIASVARVCTQLPGNIIPLPSGVGGAGIILLIQILIVSVIKYCTTQLKTRIVHRFHAGHAQHRSMLTPWQRVQLWIEETRLML